ncbi:replication factor A protein 3 [Gonapodya prolifera JEL478]|uniref:Replication factor A protein 3 n=1 Tax=Gonapodya prolifera (strain JEL478) TaxID=1344416 RepID=A0A139ALR9_GONPJ|nr:replication factor A protein 3 [Gonapodya prolifera JEL478]|eukprot:KXS17710.1 replication factor A protein 3 [Gonapodya prolifera JEL478]
MSFTVAGGGGSGDRPTPRINSAMLAQHRNSTVKLVGRLVSTGTSALTLEASDHGQVTIATLSQGHGYTTFVEITGQVSADARSVREMQVYNLGENFDLDGYDHMVQLTRKFPELFG